jgi:hypothetical protein
MHSISDYILLTEYVVISLGIAFWYCFDTVRGLIRGR